MEQPGANPTGSHGSIMDRMLGAATLNVATYEEVEHDTTATSQAAIVVGIVAIASAIGGAGGGAGGILAGIIGGLVGWLVWAGVTYLIGDKLLGGTATWGELLRTLGFAQSPGVLYVLAIVPILGWGVRFVIWIWLLIAGVIAIRQALDFSTGKAVLTAVLGFLAYVVVAGALAVLFGVPI
jgi:hypothetical protein